MRLAPESLTIDERQGFEISDIFGAKQAGERLANVVGNLDGHAVIALDGEWGTGKSVFVQQWAGRMRGRKHPVVYFDAFAHDYLDDAFFPLLCHLIDATDGELVGSDRRQQVVAAACDLIRAMPKLLADLALQRCFGATGKELRQTMEEIKNAERRPDALIEDRIRDYRMRMEYVTVFRKALTSAINSPGENLVFIIDELDRCRPSYALNILERIKHVFSADGVFFVLVAHLESLANMVSNAYGHTTERSMRYLDKFYHLRVNVGSLFIEDARSGNGHARYIDYMNSQYGFGLGQDQYQTIVIWNLARIHDATLRDLERIVFHYHLVRNALRGPTEYVSENDRNDLSVLVLPGLSVMRHLSPDLYRSAASGDLGWKSAQMFLSHDRWKPAGSDLVERSRRVWKKVTVGGSEPLPIESSENAGHSFDNYSEVLPEICRAMDMFIG